MEVLAVVLFVVALLGALVVTVLLAAKRDEERRDEAIRSQRLRLIASQARDRKAEWYRFDD